VELHQKTVAPLASSLASLVVALVLMAEQPPQVPSQDSQLPQAARCIPQLPENPGGGVWEVVLLLGHVLGRLATKVEVQQAVWEQRHYPLLYYLWSHGQSVCLGVEEGAPARGPEFALQGSHKGLGHDRVPQQKA